MQREDGGLRARACGLRVGEAIGAEPAVRGGHGGLRDGHRHGPHPARRALEPPHDPGALLLGQRVGGERRACKPQRTQYYAEGDVHQIQAFIVQRHQ